MSSRKAFPEYSISSYLDKLRISAKDVLFADVVKKEWKNFGFKKPTDADPTLLENLLIKVIEDLYNGQKAQSVKDKRECAINHDISLLMFGLLDGYYHTRTNSQGDKEAVILSIRYKQYLNTNIYVNLEYHGEGTYAEIVAKEQLERPGKQPRPLNRVTHIAGDCKEEIGPKLYDLIKSGDYKDCLRPAAFNELTGQRTDLPKPQFIPENYAPRTATGKMVISSSSSSQIEPEPNVMPKESEDDKGANTVTPQQVDTIHESILNKALGAGQPGEDPPPPKPPEPPGEKPSKGLADGLKAWAENHKVAIFLVGVLVGVLLTFVITFCRTLQQQQHQEVYEPKLPEIPLGHEIEWTRSTSYSDEKGTYVIEETINYKYIENPDS